MAVNTEEVIWLKCMMNIFYLHCVFSFCLKIQIRQKGKNTRYKNEEQKGISLKSDDCVFLR